MQKILIAALLFTMSSANAQDTTTYKWYKGNTHTHSLWSDGNDFPEMIIDWYKSHGYDFLALSDHNTLGDTIKWVELPQHPFRQNRYHEYQQKFGMNWIESKTDNNKTYVRLKRPSEYRPLFEKPGEFLLIPAEEITNKFNDKHIHINAVNVQEMIPPAKGSSVADIMQKTLDAVYAQRERTGQPMLVHINHPNFYYSIRIEDMIGLKGERFVEIFNGHPLVHNNGDSTHPGMEEIWDALLVSYIQQGKPLLYGLGTDDAHNYLEFKISTANPGRAWIMVHARELTTAAIIAAMEKGDFYASTGVQLETLQYLDKKIALKVKAEPGVTYTIQFWGGTGSNGKRTLLKEVKGTKASYSLKKTDWYVRAKIISSKPKENPFEAGELETAWTQPVAK